MLEQTRRLVYFVLAWVSLLVGIIGIFLPVLPTTPFVLLSAYFLARSSRRWYEWLINQKTIGPVIRQWEETKSIPLRAKVLATLMIAVGIITMHLRMQLPVILRVILIVFPIGVLVFIWTRPSAPSSQVK